MYMRVYIRFFSFLLWLSRSLCIDCKTFPTNTSRCYTDILPCGHSLWWILEHQDSGSGSIFYYQLSLMYLLTFGILYVLLIPGFLKTCLFACVIWILTLLLLGSLSILQGHDLFSFPIWSPEADPLLSWFLLFGFLSIGWGPCGLIPGHDLSGDMAQYCGMFIASFIVILRRSGIT